MQPYSELLLVQVQGVCCMLAHLESLVLYFPAVCLAPPLECCHQLHREKPSWCLPACSGSLLPVTRTETMSKFPCPPC